MKCEKMSKQIEFCQKIYECKLKIIEKFITPPFLLALRVFIALIFLKSGLNKLSNMEGTIFLFEYEYQVPILSPVFAAYSATFFEIVCSSLIIAGFATRAAAFILLIMTMVIQFLVVQNHDHFFWMFSLGTLIIFGAGCFSLDKIFKCMIQKCQKNSNEGSSNNK